MNMISGQSFVRVVPAQVNLPQEVRWLHGREFEIANIVFTLRAASAEDVVGSLADSLHNATVRSILNRLVRKAILKRVQSGRAFIYMPALTCADSGAAALRRFADDHFGGCLKTAAASITPLSARQASAG